MNNIELHKLAETTGYTARRWTYQPFNPRQVFKVRIADWNNVKHKCPVSRFEVVRLTTAGREDWFGVATSIKRERYRAWRSDYSISVKMFENILDAIDYSEKKRAKYVDDKADQEAGQTSSV